MENLIGQFCFLPVKLAYFNFYFFQVFYLFTNYHIVFLYILIVFFVFFFKNNAFFQVSHKNLHSFFCFFTIFFVLSNILSKKGFGFLISLFVLFCFILFQNFLSLLPYQLTSTSYISFTLCLSFLVCFSITFLGFFFFKQEFIQVVIPKNVSALLVPMLVVIETISYFMRPFSLGIRLFANILAGHALIFILLYFLNFLCGFLSVFFLEFISIFPLALSFVIFLLEIMVAFLQAYVFVVLCSIYFRDLLQFIRNFSLFDFIYKFFFVFLLQFLKLQCSYVFFIFFFKNTRLCYFFYH